MNKRFLQAALLGSALSVTLSACGKKGGLELPPSSSTSDSEAGCAPKEPTGAEPVDATPDAGKTGIQNQMPDMHLPPC